MTKRRTFKDLFSFLMDKYKENPGILDVPQYENIDGTKVVSFGVKNDETYKFKEERYTFVATNNRGEFRFYKNKNISKYCMDKTDDWYTKFGEMYEAITSQYNDLIKEISNVKKEEEDKIKENKDVPLETLVTTLKLEGKFKEFYKAIYDSTRRGCVGQIFFNKERANKELEIRDSMISIMRNYSTRTDKSFMLEFGFDLTERAEDFLKLMFDKRDVEVNGEKIELYTLKWFDQ